MATAPSDLVRQPFTVRRDKPTVDSIDPCEITDPEEAAELAGLRYVTDDQPGIARKRAGRGVRYLNPDGSTVSNQRDLARIKALVIPPAWSDVWICARSDGHLQATGRDERGRKQYRYHPRWRDVRDEAKYGRMLAFGKALPAIRERVDHDLRRPGLPHDKVTAAIVRLLDETLIRVGNDEYARTNDSYGLTTLRDDHVDVNSTSMRFAFRGKSGKEHSVNLQDRRLARIVRRCRDLPGQTLFQYVADDGTQRPVGSADVNAYLREVTGQEFTAKDFRTWHGTLLAIRALLDAEPAENETAQKRQIVAAVKSVAERLGNTPAICRRCYIHPTALDAYEMGRLAEVGKRYPKDGSRDEALVRRLLEQAMD